MKDRLFKTLLTYFAVSSIILVSGLPIIEDVEDLNLIPATVSVFLLIPLYMWYRRYRQHTKLSQQIHKRGKGTIIFVILFLFTLAMVIRIPSVLLLNMAYEKTPVIFLVVLTIVLLEEKDPSIFGFKTERFGRALLLGLVYYLLFEFSSGLVLGVLAYASTGQIKIIGFNPMPFLLTMPFMTLCVGISEEGLFRGYMQTCLSEVFSRRKAILIQAFLFGLWHFVWHVLPFNPFGMLAHITSTFMFGLLFGYFYSESNNLTPLVLTHGLVDSLPLGYILNEEALKSMQNLPLPMQILIQTIPYIISILVAFASTRYLIKRLLSET
ncbi:MAG: CPBP family intramembrane glutamic endopeptidase [Candidatus Bathyarchaeia archaeon]